MAPKVKISNKKITAKGGLIPVLKHIRSCKVPQVINSIVPKRPHWSTYSNEDIFLGLGVNVFCGKTRIAQIESIRHKIKDIPGLKIPSHDAIGRALKSLKTPSKTIKNITKSQNARIVETEINYNKPLIEMLVKATKRLGLLPSSKKHTLDIDATFVSTKCKDAKANTRKKSLGYSPMVCLIDRMPVHISLRSGNAGAALNLKEDFESCYEILKKNKIQIGRVRSDAAGYSKSFLEKIDSLGIKYNVRMKFHSKNSGFIKKLKAYSKWKPITIETSDQFWDCEIGDFPYQMHDSEMKSRIVCVRVPNDRPQTKEESERADIVKERMSRLNRKGVLKRKGKLHPEAWSNYGGYAYKVIITNDFKTSPKDIILEYNARGTSESNFSYLKRDLGWRLPPFSFLEENMVYLIVTALINNMFISALRCFNKYVKGINRNSRLPKFIDFVIDIPCLIIGKNNYTFFVDQEIIDIEKIC